MVELANHMEAIWNKQYCHLLVTQLMSTGYCNTSVFASGDK